MYEQLDIFSFIRPQKTFNPGDYVEKRFCGKRLSFDQVVQNVGKLIAIDMSTESHEWYKAVRVEKIVIVEEKERMLVYYDGHKQRGFIRERYFSEKISWTRKAFELKSST